MTTLTLIRPKSLVSAAQLVAPVGMNSPINVYEDKGSTGPTYAELEDNGYSWRRDATSEQFNGPWFPVIGNTGNSNTGGYVIAATTDEALEAAEWAAWQAKCVAAGVTIGSTMG